MKTFKNNDPMDQNQENMYLPNPFAMDPTKG